MHVVIVGAGFAGAIAARVANAIGHRVSLLDRGKHPRFALGESSTPLAALVLERLADRYGLDDLHHLAAYGRWQKHLSDLRCGLKRGFTFYQHKKDTSFESDSKNSNRLLVAASPDDFIADTHWFRQDVDEFLVCRAKAEGVTYFAETTLSAIKEELNGFCLTIQRSDRTLTLDADVVIDASGPSAVIATHLGVKSNVSDINLRTSLIYGHFERVQTLGSTLPSGIPLLQGPFPDERAAVHHLLDEGWMYELRFDDDVVSAGFVIEHQTAKSSSVDALPEDLRGSPPKVFQNLLRRYPTLDRQFKDAQSIRPIQMIHTLQRKLVQPNGRRWVVLPHTYMFLSPLFSTGIAWSLIGVERLGLVLEHHEQPNHVTAGFQRYGDILNHEATHLQQLLEGAYKNRHDFDSVKAFSQVYFAAASYCETIQRLCAPPNELNGQWAWFGFLGASDPILREIVERAGQVLQHDSPSSKLETIRRLISRRNVAGLADSKRQSLYPTDFDTIVSASEILGLSPDDIRSKLALMRSSG